jgi:hypothetical protein
MKDNFSNVPSMRSWIVNNQINIDTEKIPDNKDTKQNPGPTLRVCYIDSFSPGRVEEGSKDTVELKRNDVLGYHPDQPRLERIRRPLYCN